MKEKFLGFFKFKWLLRTDRLLHVAVVCVVTLLLGFNAGVASGITAEMKDWLWNGRKGGIFGWVVGNGFDWLDLLASMIGAGLGALVRWLIGY